MTTAFDDCRRNTRARKDGDEHAHRKRGGDKISTAAQHQDKKKNAPRKFEKGNALPPVRAMVVPHFRLVAEHAETNTDGGDDDEINIRENSETVNDGHDIPKGDTNEEKNEKIDDDNDDNESIENLKKQLELMVNKKNMVNKGKIKTN